MKKQSPLRVLMAQTAESPVVRLMATHRLTYQDVAKHLGVTRTTVGNWINGRTTPRLSLKEWDKLAKFLGTTIDKLPRNFAPNDQ